MRKKISIFNKKNYLLFLLILGLLFISNHLKASIIDQFLNIQQIHYPETKWKSIKTKHFWIHFHNGLEDVAIKMAKIAEKTHTRLTEEIGWKPALRTDIILIDNTDESNGNASPVFFNRVEIYISRPRNDSVLNNFDNWLESVFVHEYTHIIALDTAHGFTQGMRYILGRFPILFPNIYSPVFTTEGYPVYQESKNPKFGRNNSTYTDMIIRTEVNNNSLKGIDKASHFPRTWPMGNVPYLYGGLFVKYLEDTYGKGSFAKYIHEIGDNIIPFSDYIYPIPYFFNKDAKDVYGKAFHTLWKEWQKKVTNDQKKQINLIKKLGLSKYSQISNMEDDSKFPRFSKDGKHIYYVNYSRKRGRKLYKYDIQKNKNKRLCRVNMPGSLTITEKGEVFLTDLEHHNSYSLFYDVFKYNIIYSKKTIRNRSTYINSFNKSNKFVFTQKNHDKYSLILSDTKFKNKIKLIKDSHIQISYPSVSPDDNFIAFTIKEDNGFTDLVLLNLKSKNYRRLTNDLYNDIHPVWHPDGQKILFSSDRNGVYNLYEYDLKRKRIYQRTNIIGGAFYPDISKDTKKIVFSSYEKNGHRVSLLDYPKKSYKTIKARPLNLDKKFFIAPNTNTKNTDKNIKIQRYNPVYSGFPAFVLPFFQLVNYYPDNYDFGFGFMVVGSDTLFQHLYSLQLLIYPMQKNISLGLSYTFAMLYPDITIGYGDNTLFMGEDEFPWQMNQSAKFSRTTKRFAFFTLLFPILFYNHEHFFEISYFFEQTFIDTYEPVNVITSDEKLLAKVQASYMMDWTKVYSYSISKEEGLSFLVAGDIYDKKLGSEKTFYNLKGELSAYLPGFVANNVILMRLRGAIAFDHPKDMPYPFNLGRYSQSFFYWAPEGGINTWGMRGYSAGIVHGDKMAIGTLEYRFPVVQVDEGLLTAPIMFRDLWFDIFYEFGNVWAGNTNIKNFKSSVGIELNIKVTMGYYLDMVSYIGYAYGINTPGEHQVYFGISTFFEGRFLNRKNKSKKGYYL